MKSDDTLLNVEKGTEERLNKLYVLEGSKPIEVPELHAGDIGAIAKLAAYRLVTALQPRRTRCFIRRQYFPHHIPIRDLKQ